MRCSPALVERCRRVARRHLWHRSYRRTANQLIGLPSRKLPVGSSNGLVIDSAKRVRYVTPPTAHGQERRSRWPHLC